MPPLSATQTLDRARAALQSGRGAGLPELLKLIETLTTNHAEVSLDQLSELIEKDAAVLSRVLGVANTVAHNPGFTPLASVTHAIHQIGFTRVRNLALSLMLVENAGPRNAPEQREAAAQALCAGLMAQGCAQSLGSIDPDLAFACAALRNFGNILLPAVSIDHYREVVERLKTNSEDVAYRGIFGLTPLELSRKILAPSKLPEEITRSLRDCKPEAMGGVAASTYDAKLLGVADFGGQLAKITLDGTSSADSFAERSRALARRYEKIIPGAKDAIEPALLHTDDRIATFTQNNGAASLPTPSLRRIKDRVNGQAPGTSTYTGTAETNTVVPAATEKSDAQPTPVVESTQPVLPPAAKPAPIESSSITAPVEAQLPSKIPAAFPSQVEAHPPESWSEALSKSPEFETQPETVPAPEASTDPWSAALKFVHDGFGAQECWLFLPKTGGESLPLTQGIGTHWKEFKKSAALRLDERTVFGVCLTRRENVVIHDTTAATLTPYLPAWFRKTSGAPGAFLLMPLHEKKITHGLILIGWEKPQRITVSPAQTELARQMFASVSSSERSKVAS
ncbi:MAG TPA: HDOD domain-containing protein [Lacunisphaera sp.]